MYSFQAVESYDTKKWRTDSSGYFTSSKDLISGPRNKFLSFLNRV